MFQKMSSESGEGHNSYGNIKNQDKRDEETNICRSGECLIVFNFMQKLDKAYSSWYVDLHP